jgi:hypothetical protein
MNMPIVRLYAATTHWSPLSPTEKSCWIAGSATFTMVASRKIMKRPRPVATSSRRGWTRRAPELISAVSHPLTTRHPPNTPAPTTRENVWRPPTMGRAPS